MLLRDNYILKAAINLPAKLNSLKHCHDIWERMPFSRLVK